MSKIALRPIADADTANIVSWRNSEAVKKNLIDRNPITEESHRAYLEKYVYSGQRHQFIICVNDGEKNQDIGSCFVKNVDMQKSEAEIGLFIGEETARGKGYAKFIISQLLLFCFDELKLDNIILWVLDTNEVARRVYQKIGFVEDIKNEEGFIRMHLGKTDFRAIENH